MGNQSKLNHNPRIRGNMTLYAVVIAIPLLIGFGSFAVDMGRIQAAKSQLQSATDAAARYAAVGLRSKMQSTSGASANATAVFGENQVDGTQASFNAASDLQMIIWSSVARTYIVTTDPTLANAVRIKTSLTLGDSSHPLMFLSMMNKTITIHAESIAMITGNDASTYVSAKGNPWLAGMPAGSVTNNFRTSSSEWDYAGTIANDLSSPATISLSKLNISAGGTITFDGVTGSANFGGGTTFTSDADGDPNLTANLGSPSFGSYANFTSSMNGMSNCHAPVNALMAVFLTDSAPDSSPAPTTPLDFGTAAARDYTSLSPALKQVFFVGDGRRSNGEIQQIVVPAGATRMYVSNMDGWQFNNNTGGFNLTVHAVNKVSSVLLK